MQFRKAEKDINSCEKKDLENPSEMFPSKQSVGELFSSQDLSIDDDVNGISSYLLRHETKLRSTKVICPCPSPNANYKPVAEILDRPMVEYV